MRLAPLVLVIAAIGLSLASFNAAWSARRAANFTQNAVSLHNIDGRTALLDRAIGAEERAWGAPLRWHGAANEVYSWALAAQAEGAEDLALYTQSAQAAEAAVMMGPIQPKSWLRLAALDLSGVANGLCAFEQCLEMSWRAAPVTESEFACDRLRLAHSAGVQLSSDDERLRWYAAARPLEPTIAACLDFLPPEKLFNVLVWRKQYYYAGRRLSANTDD